MTSNCLCKLQNIDMVHDLSLIVEKGIKIFPYLSIPYIFFVIIVENR